MSTGTILPTLLPNSAGGSDGGEDRRYFGPRTRKLNPEQEHHIRVAASRGSSLRALAADHGVSHQTVARVVRQTHPDSGIPSIV